jgi:uncharacterized protein
MQPSVFGLRSSVLARTVVALLLAAMSPAPHLALAANADTALIDAAKKNDLAAVRALVDQRANVNATAPDGGTALHWASYRDNVDAAALLIRAGAHVNAANDLGATPLWLACINASVPMVRALLAAGANPNLALLRGETPLMLASRTGNPQIVELLLQKGANVNAKAARNQNALMWAVAQKHPDVTRVLLAHGADVQARSDAWNYVMAVPPHGVPEYNRAIPFGNDTALMFAARVGDAESARLLLDAGANPNDADAWGISAMVLAAHSGFRDLVELLLSRGADVNSAAAGFSALHEAIMRRDEKLVATLLAHGADVSLPVRTWTPERRSSEDFNFAPSLVGATPFWLAARFNEPAVMRMLVEHGADPLFVHRVEYYQADINDRRTAATTALLAATGIGGGRAWVPIKPTEREARMLETVKLAIELGVDVNAANADGRTALDAAQALKYESVVKYLMERGAKNGTKPAATRPTTR